MQVEQSEAYVLCARAYRNTSALVDFFTLEHGKIRAVVNGLYSQRKEKIYWQGLLRPLQAVSIEWHGHTDLKSLRDVNASLRQQNYQMQGQHLYCAFYINELLSRSLQNFEPYQDLFSMYENSLAALAQAQDMQTVLRFFEIRLLQELGYGLNFENDIDGNQIEIEQYYQFDPRQGFYVVEHYLSDKLPPQHNNFKGEHLLALAQFDLQQEEVKLVAKHILRIALREHIGSKPLASRQFFNKLN